MGGRIFSLDAAAQSVEKFHYDESDGSFTIEDVQKVDNILDVTHALRGEQRDRKAFQRHVGSVPENIYWHFTMKWRKQGMSSEEIRQKWIDWLNDPDNKGFKSIEGRI